MAKCVKQIVDSYHIVLLRLLKIEVGTLSKPCVYQYFGNELLRFITAGVICKNEKNCMIY